jgi:hypothetical protein
MRWLLSLSVVSCMSAPPSIFATSARDAGLEPVAQQPTVPSSCTPVAAPPSNLLKLSTKEYQQVVGDVLNTPVEDSLFARWTPVAGVNGFDTLGSSRIDQRGFEEQWATATTLAQRIVSAGTFTRHCPAAQAPAGTPRCSVKQTYASMTDYATIQGGECWSYLDGAGQPLVFDRPTNRWRMEPDQGAYLWDWGSHPGNSEDVVRRWTSPIDGTVRLTTRFRDADPGGGDGVAVSIKHRGQVVWSERIANGGPEAVATLSLPVVRDQPIDFVVQRVANPNFDTTQFSSTLELTPLPRTQQWTWASCAEPLVTRVGGRLFRRPLRPEEVAEAKTLFESTLAQARDAGVAEPAEAALVSNLEALLLSPNLFFKPELAPGGFDSSERAFATASRLSFVVRGSVADDDLWAQAQGGQLGDAATLRRTANRLLSRETERFTTSFGGQWLDFRTPYSDTPLALAMKAESAAVFGQVFDTDLPPERLLRPGFTYLSGPLGTHYGLTGSGFVDTGERGGLLVQGGFLARTGAGSEFRRPIHRGLWVLTRLLCWHRPELPQATLDQIAASLSTIDRTLPLPEQMKLHRNANSSCGGCHVNIDPVGLALEHYGPTGAWRQTYENGAAIESDLSFEGKVVRTPSDLASAIETSEAFRTCVAQKLLTFSLSRVPTQGEHCIAEAIAEPKEGKAPSLKAMSLDALMHALSLGDVNP